MNTRDATYQRLSTASFVPNGWILEIHSAQRARRINQIIREGAWDDHELTKYAGKITHAARRK